LGKQEDRAGYGRKHQTTKNKCVHNAFAHEQLWKYFPVTLLQSRKKGRNSSDFLSGYL
jgi:hypothetical protein